MNLSVSFTGSIRRSEADTKAIGEDDKQPVPVAGGRAEVEHPESACALFFAAGSHTPNAYSQHPRLSALYSAVARNCQYKQYEGVMRNAIQ
jgi:hypothetical protein